MQRAVPLRSWNRQRAFIQFMQDLYSSDEIHCRILMQCVGNEPAIIKVVKFVQIKAVCYIYNTAADKMHSADFKSPCAESRQKDMYLLGISAFGKYTFFTANRHLM